MFLTEIDTTEWLEWSNKVSSWQDMTKDVPRLVRQDIAKGRMKTEEPSRGIKALMYDPLSIQYAMGYKDRKYSLTYDVLKRIPHQLSLIGAIINTRVNQVASFCVPFRASKSLGFVVKHKDPTHLTSKSEQKFIKELEQFVYNCGHSDPNPHNNKKRDDFETFLKKIVRDSLMFDQICFEIVPDRRGQPYEFVAVDASTIRLAASNSVYGPNETWHNRSPAYSGRLLQFMLNEQRGPYRSMQMYSRDPKFSPSFVQIINGQIENVYSEEELAFGVRNPRTDIYIQGYGYSELEQLITIITSHLYAEEYNRRFFMQGCVAGDTPVHTSKGIVPIDSLVGTRFQSWNGTEFVDADVVESGYKEAVQVELSNNFNITTSPTHKFLSLDINGQPAMVPASSLKPGDWIAQADTLVEFEPLESTPVLRGASPKQPPVEAGLLDAEFYEFVGFLVGDGFISNIRASKNVGNKRNYTISCVFGPKDSEVRDRFMSMLSSRSISFHMRKSGGQYGGSPIDCLTVRNKGLFDFLVDTVGMSQDKSRNKAVPSRVFSESVENRGAFLRGYFSADGFTKNGMHPFVCSTSPGLISGVQQVLWSLGISSSLSHVLENSTGPCYYLRVCDPNKFADLVGFIQTYKKVCPTRADSGGKLPPNAQSAAFTEILGKPFTTKRSRTQLKKLSENNGQSLEVLDYRWTTVKSVTSTGVVIPMYDVRQVDEKHRWSAGGCVTSNSAPKGILNFKGDTMTPDMLEGFRRQWRASLESVENSWRTPILQSEAGLEWIDLHPTNREMEYNAWIEYLIKITCFTENTPVTLADGSLQRIADVKPGDMVKTHVGTDQCVKNLQISTHNGKLHHIRAGEVMEVTPEHPLYVASSGMFNGVRQINEPGWKEAKHVVEGVDYLCVPKKGYSSGTCDTIDITKYLEPGTYRVSQDGKQVAPKSNRVTWVSRYVPLTVENSFALGLYLSEGNTTSSAAFFTFAANESQYVDAIEKFAAQAGCHSKCYSAKKSTANIRIHSSILAKFLSNAFGSTAKDKKVPIELMESSQEVQRSFFSGVFAGDGSVPNFSSDAVVATISLVSHQATEQLRSLLLVQDIYSHPYTVVSSGFSNVNRAVNSVQRRLDVNGAQARKLASWLSGPKGSALRERIGPSVNHGDKVYEDSCYFFVPVSETWTTDYQGLVYNIEVEGEHTYQANRFAVHNCAIFLMDPAELNFDLHGGVQQTPLFESSQEWKLKASRDRGLKPLLRFIAKMINEHVVSKIDDHFVFDFIGLDELTEQEKHTLRTEQVSSYLTLNEVRRSDDLDDLEYGDMPMNPTYLQAMQIKMQMEQQKQQMEQQKQAQQVGAVGAPPGQEGQPGAAAEEPAPEYADRFQKSLRIEQGAKFLEIELEWEDRWKEAMKG